MNNIIKRLAAVANELDAAGFEKEAVELDTLLAKLAQDPSLSDIHMEMGTPTVTSVPKTIEITERDVKKMEISINNEKAQKMLNELLTLWGEPKLMPENGNLTHEQAKKLKEVTKGYASWKELFSKLQNLIANAQAGQSLEAAEEVLGKEPTVPKASDPSKFQSIEIEPLPAMPSSKMPSKGMPVAPKK